MESVFALVDDVVIPLFLSSDIRFMTDSIVCLSILPVGLMTSLGVLVL